MPTQGNIKNTSKGAAKRIQDLERELAAVRAAVQHDVTGNGANDDSDESSPESVDQGRKNSLIDSAFGTSVPAKRSAKGRTRRTFQFGREGDSSGGEGYEED